MQTEHDAAWVCAPGGHVRCVLGDASPSGRSSFNLHCRRSRRRWSPILWPSVARAWRKQYRKPAVGGDCRTPISSGRRRPALSSAGCATGRGRCTRGTLETSPFIGKDHRLGSIAGADGDRTMMLVYNLPAVGSIFRRFGGVDGSAYFVGGFGFTALNAERSCGGSDPDRALARASESM